MRPLHDAQLSKLMKIDSSGIDINDTGTLLNVSLFYCLFRCE
jgi:hypothetical protein